MAEGAVNPFARPMPEKVKGARGRDVRKQEKVWEDVEKLYEFEDGWYIGWVKTPADQATLGRLQGHCSGTHFIWTCEEKIWYFFALFDNTDTPRSTIHAKHATWLNKSHPRDSCPRMPSQVVANHRYGYPSLKDVEEAFKAAGLTYEPGKYCPITYNSTTYDYNLSDPYEGDEGTFAYNYGRAMCTDRKPANVDKEIWDAYAKAAKAVEDNYNKNKGAIKVQGRRFKFDGKWLIVLSASNKSQTAANGTAGKKIAEWLNSTGRKK